MDFLAAIPLIQVKSVCAALTVYVGTPSVIPYPERVVGLPVIPVHGTDDTVVWSVSVPVEYPVTCPKLSKVSPVIYLLPLAVRFVATVEGV